MSIAPPAPLSQASPMQMQDLSDLSSGFGRFTLDLYQQVIQSTSDNVFFSPLSIISILALVSQAASGKTFDEIKKSAYLYGDKAVIANQFSAYNLLFQNSIGNATFSMVNQIYVHHYYPLKKSFQEVAVEKFSVGIEPIDFNKNIEAAEKINNFVKNKTNDKIKDLIKGTDIKPENRTRVILVNANYFKGDWLRKFDKKLTKVDVFYISETETVSVDFMHITSNFRMTRFNDLDATSLQLQYANSNLLFLIVLPRKREGLSKLEGKLEDYDLTSLVGDFHDSYEGHGCEVILPKFKVEFEIKLNDILKNLGMTEMFDEFEAKFTDLLESDDQLFVSEVLHKSFIEINEEGAEASSATRLKMEIPYSDTVTPKIPQFRVDHPFLYYIWDTQTRTPVFFGRIMKPGGSR